MKHDYKQALEDQSALDPEFFANRHEDAIRSALELANIRSLDEPPEDDTIVLVVWPNGVRLRSLYKDGEFLFTSEKHKSLVTKIGYIGWLPMQEETNED